MGKSDKTLISPDENSRLISSRDLRAIAEIRRYRLPMIDVIHDVSRHRLMEKMEKDEKDEEDEKAETERGIDGNVSRICFDGKSRLKVKMISEKRHRPLSGGKRKKKETN